jgi:phosphatidylglycerol:prolipoprotein diacylglycerol transferase
VVIDLNPVPASFGPFAVRWSGVLALAGLALAIWLGLRMVARRRLGRRAALDALAWGLPAGIVCGRVAYVLGYWDYYLTNASELWQPGVSGLSLWGGLLGGGLIAAARLGRDPLCRRRIFDAIVPGAALGVAMGRIGQFLDGSGQGVPAQLPWATRYVSPLAATPDFGVPRHPAQLYDAVAALGMCALVLALPRAAPAGSRVALALVGYGVARVASASARTDPTFLFGLQLGEWLALAGVLLGLWYGLGPVVSAVAGARAGQSDRARTEPTTREDSLAA